MLGRVSSLPALDFLEHRTLRKPWRMASQNCQLVDTWTKIDPPKKKHLRLITVITFDLRKVWTFNEKNTCNVCNEIINIPSLGTNISLKKAHLKMIFLFARWHRLVPWVYAMYVFWGSNACCDLSLPCFSFQPGTWCGGLSSCSCCRGAHTSDIVSVFVLPKGVIKGPLVCFSFWGGMTNPTQWNIGNISAMK